MLFNSYAYILVFLPISLIIYFYLNKIKNSLVSNYFLVAASFFFYSYWDPKYLLLMLISVIFNYSIGTLLSKMNSKKAAKTALFTGIAINLVALGYYKYADFFIKSTNAVAGTNFDLQHIVLPLAISFFTFQQIAYLVDSYRGLTKEYDFLNYCLFVSFFPQLIAGPIVHHKEMMPQFEQTENKKFIYE
ncbi:MAG TPA: MBOAT family O-acyltransferase, partial [bacterium]|nr:MBOAT family O-acyltransferase [bacterium]